MQFVLYLSQNYSFEILRPLASVMSQDGHEVRWFVEGNAVDLNLFKKDERRLLSVKDLVNFKPDAVFAPGNIVPSFIPGLKVQVFHGFEWKKKGHFRIRGCFDLYCTQGPFFTNKFLELKNNHPHFNVRQTGWPKLDPMFSGMKDNSPKPETGSATQILYAPTFSPKLTSANDIFEQIVKISHDCPWVWQVKFHPKMDKKIIEAYQAVAHEKLRIVESQSILPLLQQCDVMVSDTSSVITEFLLTKKPVITFNNAKPEDIFLNIKDPAKLYQAINQALSPSSTLTQRIDEFVEQMHPYQDGESARRVVECTIEELKEYPNSANKPKPLNLIRNLKLRKKLGYWSP